MVCKRTQKPKARSSAETSPLPCGRAAWCGQLQLGDCQLPVKAYPATVTARSSALCQVHAGCGRKIQQRKICPKHGELAAEEIGKAYVYGPDELVALSNEELTRLDVADEKTIALKRFVAPQDFHLWLLSGRAHFLVPAHAAAGADYGAVLLAMQATRAWGVGDMVLTGRRQPVAVCAQGKRLLLFLLHRPDQCRSCPVIEQPPVAPLRSRIRDLKAAIKAGNGPMAWQALTDDWDERLTALVQRKRSQSNSGSIGRRRTASRRGQPSRAKLNGSD